MRTSSWLVWDAPVHGGIHMGMSGAEDGEGGRGLVWSRNWEGGGARVEVVLCCVVLGFMLGSLTEGGEMIVRWKRKVM
jgi:hypothetical protein